MIGKICGIMVWIALIAGVILGKGEALGQAVLDSVSEAVTLTISLSGMMAFWSGVLAVLQEAGWMRRLARLARPFIRMFFPEAARSGEGVDEICANISANLLGLGNAATPMGLAAMRKLQAKNPHPEAATGDMITLVVLNTASVSVVPSTVITLLSEAGAADPFRVVGGVWICSGASALVALGLTRLCRCLIRPAGKQGGPPS
jgi:spore maturation protein A